MRRTLIALAAAGLLVVTGCSDSDSGDPSGDEDAAEETTANDESGDESGDDIPEGFCSDFQSLNDQFSEDPEASADPEAVATALESLDPPDEIAEDFATLIEVSRSTADIDPNDPEAVAELQAEAGEAQARVASYLTD
ncbi:MAG: hypothetical protein PV358_18110, partial [Acidimicrobiales bacterium]|nr:hypothetical protein [Acidimicrobiales bacterium]